MKGDQKKISEPDIKYEIDFDSKESEEKVEVFRVSEKEMVKLQPYLDEARASGYIKNFSFEKFKERAKRKYAEKKS